MNPIFQHILTYLAASKTVDFVVSGKGGYAKRGEILKQMDIVYTLITRLEIARLHTEIGKIDKNAFVVMNSIKDVNGGMIKKKTVEMKIQG